MSARPDNDVERALKAFGDVALNYRSFGGIPLRFDRDQAVEAAPPYREGAAFAPLAVQARPSAAELYPLLGAAVPEARSVRLDPRVGPRVAYGEPPNQPAFAPAAAEDFGQDGLAQRALASAGRLTRAEPPRPGAPPSPTEPPPSVLNLALQPRPQTIPPQSRAAPPAIAPAAAPQANVPPATPPVARPARPLMTSLLGASTRPDTRTPLAPPPAPVARDPVSQVAAIPPAEPAWASPFERLRAPAPAPAPVAAPPMAEAAIPPVPARPVATRPAPIPPAAIPPTVSLVAAAAPRATPPRAMADVFRALAVPRAHVPPAQDPS